MICRDVYGKHPREMAGAPFSDTYLIDFMALAIIEGEEHEQRLKDAKNRQ